MPLWSLFMFATVGLVTAVLTAGDRWYTRWALYAGFLLFAVAHGFSVERHYDAFDAILAVLKDQCSPDCQWAINIVNSLAPAAGRGAVIALYVAATVFPPAMLEIAQMVKKRRKR